MSGFSWHLNNWGYVIRCERKNGVQKIILMHRQILNAQHGQVVDHKNRIKTDNRKENLRFVTAQQNSYNTRKQDWCLSQYKGVTRIKGRKVDSNLSKPWKAAIRKAGVDYRLGYFATELEAAMAYDKRALELFGEFAGLNFPLSITIGLFA